MELNHIIKSFKEVCTGARSEDDIKRACNIFFDKISEFYQINCCDKSTLDNYGLTIDGSILETTDIKNALLVFEIDIQYYYLNENDEVCEILYLGRTFTYDGSSSQFSITVSPKNTINDFKSFYGFNIEYTIIEADGRATH